MNKKKYHAQRRLIAAEIGNNLRVRRSLRQLRTDLDAGLPPNELVSTPRGRVPRWLLMAFADRVYRATFANVIAARKALLREQGLPAPAPRPGKFRPGQDA